jgi:P-type Ca2+ transporter type 2C
MLGFFLVYFLQGYPIIFNGFTIKILGNPPLYVYMLATTVFHTGVVIAQIGNVFACRSDIGSGRRLGWFSNRHLWGAVVIEAILILGIIYYAPLARIFDHVALPPYYWIGLCLFAFAIFALEEGRKLTLRFFRRRAKALFKEK